MADDITGITEPAQLDAVTIFPNPARDRLTIKSNHRILRVSVFNSLGKNIYKIRGTENFLNLNTADFEPGVYLFRVQTIEGLITRAVVFEKR